MKKYMFYALCGLVSSVLFASCNKNDVEPDESYSEKIVYDKDGTISSKETYKFDAQGRVISYEYIVDNEISVKEHDFNYDGNTATYKREAYGKSYTGNKVFRTEKCNYDDFLTNQYFENETEIFNETRTFNENGLITKYSKINDGIREECEYSYTGNKITYRKKLIWNDEIETTDYTAEFTDANYKQLTKISIVLDPETETPRTKENQYTYDDKGRINGIKYFYEGELIEEQKDYVYNGSKVTYKDCLCDNGEVYCEFTCEETNWDEVICSATMTSLGYAKIIKVTYTKTEDTHNNPETWFWDDDDDYKYSISEYRDAGITVCEYTLGDTDFYLTYKTGDTDWMGWTSFSSWYKMNENEANQYVAAYKQCNSSISSYQFWVQWHSPLSGHGFNSYVDVYKYVRGVHNWNLL